MRHHAALFATLCAMLFVLQSVNAQEKPKGTEKPMTQVKDVKATKDTVVIETTMGTIEVALFRPVAPKAVENFVGLARKGYYDGLIFHRVMDRFMIQGGDPRGNGTGGESIYGAPFEDEISPNHKFDRPGLLAMANSGGGKSNGSQFFITTVPTDWLNGRHTIFGEVTSGMDVVNAIEKVPTVKANNKPIKDVVMTAVYVKGEKKAAEEKKK